VTARNVSFAFLCEGSSDTGLIAHLETLLVDFGAQEATGMPDTRKGTIPARLQQLLTEATEAGIDMVFIHRDSEGRLRITYADGRGLLRTILVKASEMGFETMVTASRQMTRRDWKGAVVDMRVSGKKDVSDLLSVLSMVDGVVEVEVLDDEH